MSIYDEMQSIAASVLKEFDQRKGDGSNPNDGLFFVTMTPGNGPPDNPGPPIPVAYPMNGAVRGVQFKYVGTTVNGSTIVATDFQCVVAVDARFAPTDLTGFIRKDGVQYKIVSVQPIPAAGTPVAYRFIFRK